MVIEIKNIYRMKKYELNGFVDIMELFFLKICDDVIIVGLKGSVLTF